MQERVSLAVANIGIDTVFQENIELAWIGPSVGDEFRERGKGRVLARHQQGGNGNHDSDRDESSRIEAQRLYRLIDLPRVEDHILTLELENGIDGYAFTFG